MLNFRGSLILQISNYSRKWLYPSSSTPVSSTTVSSTPVSSTVVLSTQYFYFYLLLFACLYWNTSISCISLWDLKYSFREEVHFDGEWAKTLWGEQFLLGSRDDACKPSTTWLLGCSICWWNFNICPHLFKPRKYLNKNFWLTTVFTPDCKSIDGAAKLPNLQELSPRRYLRSGHCFADSCKLEGTTVWRNSVCYINRPGMPHPYSMLPMQWAHAAISWNYSSKITVCENLDPRNIQ